MTYLVKIYPHNDLLNLAYYHRKIINNKESERVEDALGLDCLSCLISLAFSVEALVNFVGYKKIKGWQERQLYRNKITQVCREAGLVFNKKEDPYKTLWELKKLRDSIAHGQPIEVTASVATREELRRAMECPWDRHLTSEYINHAYEMIKQFERQLLHGCRISIEQTLTSYEG